MKPLPKMPSYPIWAVKRVVLPLTLIQRTLDGITYPIRWATERVEAAAWHILQECDDPKTRTSRPRLQTYRRTIARWLLEEPSRAPAAIAAHRQAMDAWQEDVCGHFALQAQGQEPLEGLPGAGLGRETPDHPTGRGKSHPAAPEAAGEAVDRPDAGHADTQRKMTRREREELESRQLTIISRKA